MKQNEKTAEILNDLIQINNDRVAGYEKASKETGIGDGDLRTLFADLAADSRQYATELKKYVFAEGEKPTTDTTLRGKIYRAWMDVKATFSGKDRKSVLESCEFGEDAAQRAYEAALKDSDELSPEIASVVREQQRKLRNAHDNIKALRDRQKANA
ncbi:PA2169 family four-helix-bundle protein [Pollutibacter soli]|uniref:PA2169 family four-helix-bundle protein n=1 Tax=Pollutibacter soli TaxID=3034157 RepID=UPI003013D0A7